MPRSLLYFHILIIIFLFHNSISKNSQCTNPEINSFTSQKFQQSSTALNYTSVSNIYLNHITGHYYIVNDTQRHKNAVASAIFEKAEIRDGWNYLSIKAYEEDDGRYTDEEKAYAMGYLEGYLTRDMIYDFFPNVLHAKLWFNNLTMPDNYIEFYTENLKYMKEKAIKNRHNSSYWEHVYYLYRQMIGVYDGYNENVVEYEKISFLYFQILFTISDIDDIHYYKKKNNRPNFKNMSKEDILDYINLRVHCSALIKIKDDFSDIFLGHNTWTNYNFMMRIFKEYRFTTHNKHEKSKTIAFSSYPGVLSSKDDFYYTGSKLYVMETTNSVLNDTLYDNLTPYGLLYWVRTMLSNRLAGNSKEWVDIFKNRNTGTYNNQFMVFDMKKYNLTEKKLENGAFYIVEQLPGYIEYKDVTEILRKGYWPSYNVAFLPKIRELSGFYDIIKEKPDIESKLSYSGCPRAKIFRRDQSNVTDISSFKHLLRSNNYLTDPFSEGLPDNQLASRYDLNAYPRNYCYGAIDAKAVSAKELIGIIDDNELENNDNKYSDKKSGNIIDNINGKNILTKKNNKINKKQNKKRIIHIISGPTNQEQPTFNFATSKCGGKNPDEFYRGKIRDKWDFDWVEYELKLFDDE